MVTNEQVEDRMDALEQRVKEIERLLKRPIWPEDEETVRKKAEELMARYGERVSKTEAAKILGVTRPTVYAMLADGRIRGLCGGKYVSVSSIEQYMQSAFWMKNKR